MRRVNKINEAIEDQTKYYEDNRDYSDLYLDMLGDRLDYDGVYSEEDVYKILDSELTTDTDYGYGVDDAVAVFPMGEIEIMLDVELTQKEYEAIENKLDPVTKFYPATDTESAYIVAYICTGMNIRVYSDHKIEKAA